MKLAVVTGGTSGLGRELSLAFARAGYAVLAVYFRNDAAAEGLRAEIAGLGPACEVLRHDVGEPAVADALAQSPLLAQATELVLVNNAAAPFQPKPIHLTTSEEMSRIVDTALKGTFHCTKGLLRALVAKHGVVVNVLTAAVQGDVPKGFGAYAAAKLGVLGLTKALHAEYGAQGLRVFSVSPGFLDTPLTAAWDPRMREHLAGDVVRSAADVAASIVTLVTSGAGGRGEDCAL